MKKKIVVSEGYECWGRR